MPTKLIKKAMKSGLIGYSVGRNKQPFQNSKEPPTVLEIGAGYVKSEHAYGVGVRTKALEAKVFVRLPNGISNGKVRPKTARPQPKAAPNLQTAKPRLLTAKTTKGGSQ